MTPIPPLTLEMTKKERISLVAVQFLQHHNRLDGWMSLAGVWWGLLTLLYPNFWYGWPVTEQLHRMTGGFPGIISWILLLSGLLTYLCTRMHWPRLRILCSLFAFVCWAMLTVAFLVVKPIFAPAVACYSLFAAGKLLSYVNHVIRIEEHSIVVPRSGHDDA